MNGFQYSTKSVEQSGVNQWQHRKQDKVLIAKQEISHEKQGERKTVKTWNDHE